MKVNLQHKGSESPHLYVKITLIWEMVQVNFWHIWKYCHNTGYMRNNLRCIRDLILQRCPGGYIKSWLFKRNTKSEQTNRTLIHIYYSIYQWTNIFVKASYRPKHKMPSFTVWMCFFTLTAEIEGWKDNSGRHRWHHISYNHRSKLDFRLMCLSCRSSTFKVAIYLFWIVLLSTAISTEWTSSAHL